MLPTDLLQADPDVTTVTGIASINMASSQPGLANSVGVTASAKAKLFATGEHVYLFTDRSDGLRQASSTQILKFRWSGNTGAIEYAAHGAVPGSLLNQFSADEAGGQLRVVTEISNIGRGNFSGNNETGLFVLEDDGGVLEFVGSLHNLALGENVRSVRFYEDRAFVTTFAQTDPLRAIDLSDPQSPQPLGHVPLPGFNSYMHFIAEDRLLTVGRNTATGLGGRTMVSLFDVADLTAPRRLDQYDLPSHSQSEANVDHHAFGWFSRHQVLAIPYRRTFWERYDADDDNYAEAERRVSEDALTLLHVGSGNIAWRGQVDHRAEVMRSLYIGDFAYSIGVDAIKSVAIASPDVLVGELPFENSDAPEFPLIPRVAASLDAVDKARNLLAETHGAGGGASLLVSQESRGVRTEIVLRQAGTNFRYRIDDGGAPELLEQGFEFGKQWHNQAEPFDVNGDGRVTAGDALSIINEMAARRASAERSDRALRQLDFDARFADTNDDGRVSALDAVRVVNALARARTGSAEQLLPFWSAPTSNDRDWENEASRDDRSDRLF